MSDLRFSDLRKLISGVVSASGDDDVSISGLDFSSRSVGHGDAFFALRGSQVDGHQFIPDAIKKGVACVVAEEPEQEGSNVAWLQVKDSRLALSSAAAAFYDHPSKEFKVGGVTGTNGKTTVAFLLHHLLKTSLHRCGLLGTVHYDNGLECVPASHTTPEPLEIQRRLRDMRDQDCRAVAMEVSSHALTQQRIAGVEFDVGIFTNLSQITSTTTVTWKSISKRNAFSGITWRPRKRKSAPF